MPPVVAVQPDIADALLAHAGSGLSDQLERAREGKLRAFDVGVRARIRPPSAAREITSHNVPGLLPATGGGGKETVAIPAHPGHPGIGGPGGGEPIYNSAPGHAAGPPARSEM